MTLVLAIVAALILVGGVFGRPSDVSDAPPTVPSDTELEQLARRAERRALEGMTRYFEGVGREAASSLVLLRGAGVTGIAWDERRALAVDL